LQARLEQAGSVQVKRDETPEDAKLRRERERLLFYAALGATIALFILILIAIGVLAENDSRRVIAERTLPLFVGGFIGYLFGKRG
jgi:uncharacterized membrane protein